MSTTGILLSGENLEVSVSDCFCIIIDHFISVFPFPILSQVFDNVLFSVMALQRNTWDSYLLGKERFTLPHGSGGTKAWCLEWLISFKSDREWKGEQTGTNCSHLEPSRERRDPITIPLSRSGCQAPKVFWKASRLKCSKAVTLWI